MKFVPKQSLNLGEQWKVNFLGFWTHATRYYINIHSTPFPDEIYQSPLFQAFFSVRTTVSHFKQDQINADLFATASLLCTFYNYVFHLLNV